MGPEHWLMVIFIAQAAVIMASYELVFRPRSDKPWLEVIVGTLIWLGPALGFCVRYGLIHPFGSLVLIAALLVTGGAMMAWIFMVHLRGNPPRLPRLVLERQIDLLVEELAFRMGLSMGVGRTPIERSQYLDRLYVLTRLADNQDAMREILYEMEVQLRMAKLMQEWAFAHPDEPKALRDFRAQAEGVVRGRGG